MDSRNGHHHRMTGTSHNTASRDSSSHNTASRDQLANAMQEHQRELARLERIRLDAPRPDTDRFTNDYVDAPKLPLRKQPTTTAPVHTGNKCSGHGYPGHPGHDGVQGKKAGLDTDHFLTKQPCSEDLFQSVKKIPCVIHGRRDGEEDLKKAPQPGSPSSSPSGSPSGIICPECGLCRCSACVTPRKLPSYWLCNGNFECSADNLVDQLSCLCCVKGIFYHFPSLSATDSEEDESDAVEHPCTCTGAGGVSRGCQRWTVMGVLAVTCLPCLWCYWPLRAASAAASAGYAAYHRRGCRCSAPSSSSSSSSSSSESSPVASVRPFTAPLTTPSRKMTLTHPPVPPSRPGHARRISSGTTNSGFSHKTGVFL